MTPLIGAITVDPADNVYRHLLQSLGNKVFVAEGANYHFVSNDSIIEYQGIFCTGSTPDLRRKSQSLTIKELLAAWHQLDKNVLSELNGEYAFVIWDSRIQKAWAIRDHFGSQPLHYTHNASCFAFSQQAKPLWELPATGLSTFNKWRILDYIVDDLEHASQTETFKQNIHKTPLSGCVNWDEGKVRVTQYWKPSITPLDPDISESSVVETFRTLLAQSILKKSQGGDGIALLASGGLDSNAIHAAWKHTKQYTQENNHLISLLPEKDNRDDLECEMLMEEVAKDCPLHHSCITPEQAINKIGPLECFIHQLEDPFTIHTLCGPAPCYGLAKEKGVTQVMDGIDGDLIGGIPSNYWNYLWIAGDKKKAIFECISNHRHHEEPFSKSIKALIRMHLSNQFPALLNMLSKLRSQPDWDFEQAKSWKHELQIRDSAFTLDCIQDRIQSLRSRHPSPSCPTLTEYLFKGMLSPMLGVGVDRYAEAAHVFGLKAIHPLLDKDLAEFLLNLPWNYRSKGGKEKYLFRLLLDQNHQSKIAKHPKLPHVGSWFTLAYQRDYMMRHQRPKAACLDALNQYIDVSWIHSAWREANDRSGSFELNEDLWRMLMLGEWLVHNA